LNVDINLASLDDQAYVGRVREMVSVLDAESTTGAEAARAALQSP
jgi:formiminotetrahydrofolate cyclodeaminase